MKAPVNKIIPLSVVDGRGNRMAIFLQDCNLSCAYCHNPETQNICITCGECVEGCPGKALSSQDGKINWDREVCLQCDRCIELCRHNASPKIRYMTCEEILKEIDKSIPFIRGITLSGGECMLYPEFLLELFTGAKKRNLTCFIDSNGCVDFSKYPRLLEVCDKVMLDVKAWNEQVFEKLTGGDVKVVKKNLALLAELDKLEEIRIVCIDKLVDIEETIGGIAETIGDKKRSIPLKLIRFRNHGVRGILSNASPPTDAQMEHLRNIAEEEGFIYIEIL